MVKKMNDMNIYGKDHSYYCRSHEGERYKNWTEFMDEWKDADDDVHFLFRWDWPSSEKENIDQNYRDSELSLFFIMQRLGYIFNVKIEVCRADEKEIKEYLACKWKKMCEMWSPLSDGMGKKIKEKR